MKTITLSIKEGKRYELILQFLRKLKVDWQEKSKLKLSKDELEYHQRIIKQGGDMPYIEDVMKWQREVRKDRDLPFDLLRKKTMSIGDCIITATAIVQDKLNK